MGIINMICAICDNKNADLNVIEASKKLLSYEENYALEMKKYLCRDCD